MQRKGAWGYVMAPVTMVTLGTLLREDGHEVRVIDAPARGMSFEAATEAARAFAPELVLVNTSTPSIADDLAAARELEAALGDGTTTALFGIHPSSEHRELLGEGVDLCVVGEPELTVRELAAALARGADPRGIAGLAYLDEHGTPRLGPPREPIADLDLLPLPDWSLVDTGDYRLPLNDERFLLVATNRGCPHRCTFCNAHLYYGRTPRRRSVDHVLRELRQDVERFGVRSFMFWAEEFVLSRTFVLELCQAIERSGLDISWVCNSRVDAVTPELLAAMRRAGCWNIAYGIESGDQGILDAVGKGTTLAQIRAAVDMARTAGLQVTGHVIIGFPEETRRSVEATRRFVDSLDLDFVQFYCAMPYPGTELHRRAVAAGRLTTGDWRQWEHNASAMDGDSLRAEEVMALRRRLMLRWYLTPRRIARTLKNHVHGPRDLWTLLGNAGGFLRWM